MSSQNPSHPVETIFSVDRLASLNDGVFAVAMTLLAYNVRVPHGPLSDAELTTQLGGTFRDLQALCLSFAVAAMFWRGHIQLLHLMRQGGRVWVSASLVFLFCVVLLPITTNLYGAFGLRKMPVLIYLGNLEALALIQLGLWIVTLRELPLSRWARRVRLLPSLFVSSVFLVSLAVAISNPSGGMLICTVAFVAPIVMRLSHQQVAKELAGEPL